MKGAIEIAFKLGSKTITMITLLISYLIVIAGFFIQEQVASDRAQDQQTEHQQQTAKIIHQTVESYIQQLNAQMKTITQAPKVLSAIARDDANLIEVQQRELAYLIPGAKKVCLMAAHIAKRDATNACIPITFVTLNSMRQAKEKGSAAMAVMEAGTDNAYLLLAQRITYKTDDIAGVLLVAMKLDVMTNLLLKEYGLNGYIELQQGSGQANVIASQGNTEWKQGKAGFEQGLKNSHWRIAYWPKPAREAAALAEIPVLAIVLVVILWMWLLYEGLQQYLLKRDVVTLRQQVDDLKAGTLKRSYPVTYKVLQGVIDDIDSLQSSNKAMLAAGRQKPTSSINNKNLAIEVVEEPEVVVKQELEQNNKNSPATSQQETTSDIIRKKFAAEAVALEAAEQKSEIALKQESEQSLDIALQQEEQKPESKLEPELEIGLEQEPDLEFELEPALEFEAEQSSNSELEVELKQEPDLEFELEPAPELESEQDLGLEFESETKPEPKQALIEIDPTIFKAYDIRGIVGQSLNEQVMTVLGQVIGSEAQQQEQKQLVVGYDGRLSSPALTNALVEGILASGCDVVEIGMVPTPVLYFACHCLDIPSGVMVTGSHNPTDYNGLKIVMAGKSLAGDDIQALYQRVTTGNVLSGQGDKHQIDIIDDYIERIVGDVKLARPMKVAVDCGNGVAGLVVPKLLKALGCDVVELYCEVDGTFPNHHPDPGQPENMRDLAEAVQDHEAELGLAFDGDGDRLGVVDVTGKPIWPDRLMVLFARDLLSRQVGASIIYDVKSSNLLGDAITQLGGEAIMWQSGHSVIKNKMQETDAQLAGEMSGHIFFKERWYGFDDALYAACRLLELVAKDALNRTPTKIFAALPDRINTPEIIVEMAEGESQKFVEKLLDEAKFDGAKIITIDGLRAEYKNGWGLVRASNTTPALTLRFEAGSIEGLHHIQQQFKQQMLQVKPTLILNF